MNKLINHSKTHLYLPDELLEFLTKQADKDFKNRSQVIKEILVDWMRKKQNDEKNISSGGVV